PPTSPYGSFLPCSRVPAACAADQRPRGRTGEGRAQAPRRYDKGGPPGPPCILLPTGAPLDAGQLRQGPLDDFIRQLVVLQLAGQVRVVGGQVEVAVAAQAKQDRPRLALFLGLERLVDRGPHRVSRLGRRQYALRPGKLDGGLKDGPLRVRPGLDEPELVGVADQGRRPVVAQAARVYTRRHEAVAKGVHIKQRRHLRGVTEVVRGRSP